MGGDDVDRANDAIMLMIERQVQEIVKSTHSSAVYLQCQECGDDIPEKRRMAVRGVRHCFACADYFERKRV